MAQLSEQPILLTGTGWADYGLVDSGDGRKLERYGPHAFIRPEPVSYTHLTLPTNREV